MPAGGASSVSDGQGNHPAGRPAGGAVPLSFWSPIAYLWQDVLVALLFLAIFYGLERRRQRPWIAWVVYAVAVAYISLNVPVTLVLSTPLTWTILRAARGPLADSIVHTADARNLAAFALPAAVGMALPLLLARHTIQVRRWALIAAHRHRRGRSVRGVARGHARMASERARGARGDECPASRAARRHRRLARQPVRFACRGRPDAPARIDARTERAVGDPGVHRRASSRALRRGARSHAEPDGAGTALDSLRARLRGVPESIKGLFATLCSRYPAFDTPPELYAEVPCASLAATLAGAGYRTALFHSGRFMYLGMKSVIDHRGFEVLEDAGAIGGRVDSSFGVDEASAVERTLGWIDSLRKDERFFVTYLPIAGHHPYASNAAGPFPETTTSRAT